MHYRYLIIAAISIILIKCFYNDISHRQSEAQFDDSIDLINYNDNALEHLIKNELKSSEKLDHNHLPDYGMGDLLPSLNKMPQQNLFTFDGVNFDSHFEAGNLKQVEQIAPDFYHIWIAPDCWQTAYETKETISFYFKVSNVSMNGSEAHNVTFRIMNMYKKELNNYRNGMVPVYSAPSIDKDWRYIPSDTFDLDDTGNQTIQFSFNYTFNQKDSDEGVYFAFTFPFTYTDAQNYIKELENNYTNSSTIYLRRELLTYSPGGRNIDLITITAHNDDSLNPNSPYKRERPLPGLFPSQSADSDTKNTRPYVFQHKKYILMTARTHSQETPGNFMLRGFVESLFDQSDPVSKALLQDFVFVIIPMINPDGVVKGFYRTDLEGRDLNRYFDEALQNPEELPGPNAVLLIARALSVNQRLIMFIDFHAHSNKNSGFILTAYDRDPEVRTKMILFARLFDIYSKIFDFNACEFGSADHVDYPGIAKVAVKRLTGIVHSYTLETGYYKSKKDPMRYDMEANPTENLTKKMKRVIGYRQFEEIGRTLRYAILETLTGLNPSSKLNNTWYGNVHNLTERIYQDLIMNQNEIIGM